MNDVSAMPVWRRYASAFLAMWRGSREYGCLVIGSWIEQTSAIVGVGVERIDLRGVGVGDHHHVATR